MIEKLQKDNFGFGVFTRMGGGQLKKIHAYDIKLEKGWMAGKEQVIKELKKEKVKNG
jgi:hypothetical protein